MNNMNLNDAPKMASQTFGNNKVYNLKFNHEDDGCWYIDFPNWPFSHHNLMMVSGADDLCAFLSDDDKVSNIEVIPANNDEDHDGYAKLTKISGSLLGGSTYKVEGLDGFDREIWLCPVTLFVLGRYPKYMYIKKAAATE